MKGPAQTVPGSVVPGHPQPAPVRLAMAAREAADAVVRSGGEGRSSWFGHPDPRFAEFLRFLTYCYANGLYSSADIECALGHDPVLRELANGQRHESSAIRSFRRKHRFALEQCLARALAAGWDRGEPVPRSTRGLSNDSAPLFAEYRRPGAHIPDFEGAAAECVREAICTDAALLDE